MFSQPKCLYAVGGLFALKQLYSDIPATADGWRTLTKRAAHSVLVVVLFIVVHFDCRRISTWRRINCAELRKRKKKNILKREAGRYIFSSYYSSDFAGKTRMWKEIYVYRDRRSWKVYRHTGAASQPFLGRRKKEFAIAKIHGRVEQRVCWYRLSWGNDTREFLAKLSDLMLDLQSCGMFLPCQYSAWLSCACSCAAVSAAVYIVYDGELMLMQSICG